MSTAVVRDITPTPYTVTNTVRDRPGVSYSVGLYVRARDTTPYLIFTAVIQQLNPGGGADASDRRRRSERIKEDDDILVMVVKEYMKYTL